MHRFLVPFILSRRPLFAMLFQGLLLLSEQSTVGTNLNQLATNEKDTDASIVNQTEHTGQTSETGNWTCPKCAQNVSNLRNKNAEQRKLAKTVRLEYEMSKLLRSLGLPVAPDPSLLTDDIPERILQSSRATNRMNVIEKHEYNRELYIEGENVGTGKAATNRQCINANGRMSSCFTLKFRPEMLYGFTVHSATLRLFKVHERSDKTSSKPVRMGTEPVTTRNEPDQTGNETIQILQKVLVGTEEKTLSTVVVSITAGIGWKEVEFGHVVRQWVSDLDDLTVIGGNNDDDDITNVITKIIQVVCLSCADRTRAPFETLEAANRPNIRILTEHSKTRELRHRGDGQPCRAGLFGHCCKQEFYVDFSAIGWSNWIIYPEGYMANYCTGSCNFNLETHPLLKQNSSAKKNLLRPLGSRFSPCCAPTKLAPLKITYIESSGAIRTRLLPNVVVKECGCI